MSGLMPVSSIFDALRLLEDKTEQRESELNKDSEKTGQEKIASSKAEARREIAHIRLQIAKMRSNPSQCNIYCISNLFKQLEIAERDFFKDNEQYRKNKLDAIASNNAIQEKIDRATFDFNPILIKTPSQNETKGRALTLISWKERSQAEIENEIKGRTLRISSVPEKRSQADIQNEIRGRSIDYSSNKIEARKPPSSSVKEETQTEYIFGSEKELKNCLDGRIKKIYGKNPNLEQYISKHNGKIANLFADSTVTKKEIRETTSEAVALLGGYPLEQVGPIAFPYADALEKCSLNEKEEAQKP